MLLLHICIFTLLETDYSSIAILWNIAKNKVEGEQPKQPNASFQVHKLNISPPPSGEFSGLSHQKPLLLETQSGLCSSHPAWTTIKSFQIGVSPFPAFPTFSSYFQALHIKIDHVHNKLKLSNGLSSSIAWSQLLRALEDCVIVAILLVSSMPP